MPRVFAFHRVTIVGRTMFICAKWKRVHEGPISARRVLVYRCDEPEGYEGGHADNVLGVSWPDEDCERECLPRNITNEVIGRFHYPEGRVEIVD